MNTSRLAHCISSLRSLIGCHWWLAHQCPGPLLTGGQATSATRRLISALTALITFAVGQAEAADLPDASAGVTVVRRCLVEFEHDTAISPTVLGVLKECLVEPGARVKAGQVLGRLQDDEARAEVKLYEAEAGSDVEIRLGEAKSAQTADKVRRTSALVARNAASREEYYLHKLEAEAATLEVEQARHRHKIAAIRLEHARAVLQARELISPIAGSVVAVARRPGETVAPRDPVFQVVDTDHIRVVGRVDVADVWRLRVGQAVKVVPEVAGADLPVEHEIFEGRLTFVDTQIDPSTRTCKVYVRVENRRGLLRAGLEARIEFEPPKEESREGDQTHG